MTAGIRSANLPLGTLIEVIGHVDAGGGARSIARMAVGDLVNLLLGLATGDASAVASLQGDLVALAQSLNDGLTQEGAARAEALEQALGAVTAEARERAAAIQILVRGLGAEQADRADADADIALTALSAVLSSGRPGLCPAAFATAATGASGTLVSLDTAHSLVTPFGAAHRMAGEGLIAPRAAIPVDPDAIYVLRARYWRLADALDPNNNAVDLGIQWLDAQDADAGRTLIQRETDLQVRHGPRTIVRRVPSLTSETRTIVPPRTAVSWKPYLRAYGSDGATAVGILGVSDATFAGVFAPDLSALAAELRQIQGQIAAGLPLATPILPAFAVADLPLNGTPGRKAWARDGRAPNAAGVLEAANAGTGVEVADNGTKWVISGTNQQVQA